MTSKRNIILIKNKGKLDKQIDRLDRTTVIEGKHKPFKIKQETLKAQNLIFGKLTITPRNHKALN